MKINDLKTAALAVWCYIKFMVVGLTAIALCFSVVYFLAKLIMRYGVEVCSVIVLLVIVADVLVLPAVLGGIIYFSIEDYIEKHKEDPKFNWLRKCFRRGHGHPGNQKTMTSSQR